MTTEAQHGSETLSRGTTKVRLDAAVIVAAGIAVTAASGSTRLSAKALGTYLGVDPTAIYRHFRNKGELMEALLDELTLRSLTAVTAPQHEWRDRLRQLSQATLVEFCAHPAIAAEAMVLTTHGPGELAAIELMLDAFTEAGLGPDEVVQHYALLSSHVLSSASGIARARAGNHSVHREAGLEFSPWFDGPVNGNPRTHPRTVALNAQLASLEDREIFELGVESVIRSAEHIVAGK